MSHWAEVKEVDGKLIVERVLVGSNEAADEGESFMNSLGGRWIKTSYNARTNGFRKNFAGPGFEYDETRDAFIPPKMFASWVLDEETCNWVAPVAIPNDGKFYYWDEDTTSWVERPETPPTE